MTVEVVVGRREDGFELILTWSDAWHTACQGMSRSGKSVLTYAALAPLASRRDVIVCGVDPTGILLGVWKDHPGSQFRAWGSQDSEQAAQALDALCAEMDRRIEWLVENGRDKLGEPSRELPLLVVVMEEYPGTLSLAEAQDAAEGRKPAERLHGRIKRSVLRLVQEGAKAGVRLFIVAQRADASILDGAARSNLGTRITMRVDNRDAVTMLHPMAPPDRVDAVTKMKPGIGIIERPGEPLVMFKADLLDYAGYVAAVRAGAQVS